MKTNPLPFYLIILFFNLHLLHGSSRVSFSRPGEMMRIPSVDHSIAEKYITINISNEFLSSYQQNSSFSMNTISKSGYHYGLSYVKPVSPSNSVEMGFHVQKNILVYENINFDIGIHDIVFRQGAYESSGLNTNNLSLFAILSTNKIFPDYSISTHLGLGTGKVIDDSEKYDGSDPPQKIGAFIGFQLKKPFLNNDEDMTILTEFDGSGINVGIQIPFFKLYQINLGVTHFENFGGFALDNNAALSNNSPAITMGITMNIPRLSTKFNNISSLPAGQGVYSKTDSSILFYDPICTEIVETLRDSIRVANNQIKDLDDHKIMLLHKEALLTDSTHKYILKEKITLSKQNEAMRHLSRSLRLFYDERYREALGEVNLAIATNPNLAIAYGRRGSIYYKLDDMHRATLNWNVALQLDPEFTEIHDMLKASNENKLEAIEISKNSNKN